MSLSHSSETYRVVSVYQDGDRIVEGIFRTEDAARRAAESVRAFRSDQDEAPIIRIERTA